MVLIHLFRTEKPNPDLRLLTRCEAEAASVEECVVTLVVVTEVDTTQEEAEVVLVGPLPAEVVVANSTLQTFVAPLLLPSDLDEYRSHVDHSV